MKICFLGANGSGKTTLATYTRDYLVQACPKKASICLHASRLREFPYMFFRLVKNSLSGNNVVCDRYLYDFLVIVLSKFCYRRHLLTKIMVYIFSVFHRFDLTVYLEAHFALVKERSGDIPDADCYERRIWMYSMINELIAPEIISTAQDTAISKNRIALLVDNYFKTGKN